MTNEKQRNYFLRAFESAFEGMRNNKGGTFGAGVVKDGGFIGKGSNSIRLLLCTIPLRMLKYLPSEMIVKTRNKFTCTMPSSILPANPVPCVYRPSIGSAQKSILSLSCKFGISKY
jgi:hypothetical protein